MNSVMHINICTNILLRNLLFYNIVNITYNDNILNITYNDNII